MKMKHLSLLCLIVVIILILAGLPAFAQENQPANKQSPEPSSTPELIETAQLDGDISQEIADLYLAYALSNDPRLPVEYISNTPWDGTLSLLHLQESVNSMPRGPERYEIEKILSGTCSSSSGSLPTINNSTHFHIQYNTIGGGLTITSYVNSLETSWTTEITNFGWWAPPVLASNPPPGNRYHVRIDSLGSSLYGYVSNSGVHAGNVGDNPNSPWTETDAYATCMVLNNDYSGFPGSPQTALDATTAHEFNHSIQFGIGALTGSNRPDAAFIEGGASWMEDEVFDYANDNYNYLWPTFNMCMGEYTDSPYPYWITWRGFSERYGTGTAGGGEQVMQDFWAQTAQSASANDLISMNTALTNRSTTLADAFHAYAIAVKFNKTCGGSFALPYCFEEAAGYVSAAGSTAVHGSIGAVPGSYNGSIPDNYAINWVSLPATGGSYNVTLNNTSGGGQLRGSVVCATNTALTIVSMSQVAGSGQSATANGFNTSGCTSVVAVITNQAQTAANPGSCTSRSYTVSLSSASTPPGAFNKSSPSSGSTGVSTSPTLSWGSSSGATSYDYCYDTSINNTCNATWQTNGASTSVGLSGLNTSTQYEWHVRANNSGGTTYSNGSTTAFWTFTTQASQAVNIYLPFLSKYCTPLYYDDFSNSGSGWPVGSDSDVAVSYLSNEYQILIKTSSYGLLVRPGFQADSFAASVDVRNVTNLDGSYGLMFGISSDWSQFYTFEIYADGSYEIWRYDAISPYWHILASGASTFINTGTASNTIGVLRDGSAIDAYANGHLIANVTDNNLTGTRYLGLIAEAWSDPNQDIRFDNYTVNDVACGVPALDARFPTWVFNRNYNLLDLFPQWSSIHVIHPRR